MRRDPSDLPPSSRRPQRVGFRFATIAALVRRAGYTPRKAEDLVDAWTRYVRYSLYSGKTPESTAEHLVRFEHYQHDPWSRDPARQRVTSEAVNTAIADDLRTRARQLAIDDPAHARELLRQADAIAKRDPQSSRRQRRTP